MTYIKKYSENANFSMKLHNYENDNDTHFRLSRSNLLDMETLPKLVFTILVPLQILQTNCEF